MDRVHRYFKLDHVLKSHRRPVPRSQIECALECSPATVKRIIDDLRGYGAPIEFIREAGGYTYAAGSAFELPGLWFSPSELLALIAAHQLLTSAEPGLLADTLTPLRDKVERMLRVEHLGSGELMRRVRFIRMAGRGVGRAFEATASALAQRRRMSLLYRARKDDRESRRHVSPQRLTHYRDNWYLDAWCHTRRALRSFALERIADVRMLEQPARDISDADLDRHFAAAYGIFAGPARHEAVLHFSAERARWVAEEQWHPRQVGQWLTDGRYELRVPYGDPRELVMDILRHGEHVEVVAPEELRREVVGRLRAALGAYLGGLTD
jgi:predicted DNA-binding transcriptional regulator YafY